MKKLVEFAQMCFVLGMITGIIPSMLCIVLFKIFGL